MDPFQLTDDAVGDIDAIWLYLLNREGVQTADRIVTDLFKCFYKLAEVPNSGHRRPDLTSRPVLFYKIFSYLRSSWQAKRVAYSEAKAQGEPDHPGWFVQK